MVVAVTPDGRVAETRKNASGEVAVASTTPTLSKAAALSRGKMASAAATQDAPEGELVIYAGGDEPRLAYEVVTTGIKADQTPSRVKSYVDAENGALLASWDEIVHAAGTGESHYVGNVPLTTSGSTGAFTLEDEVGNVTTDLNHSTYGNGEVFTDEDNAWGDGTTSDRATAAVDAHFGAENTYKYFESVHERRGIWDDGRGARSRVHYGTNYGNAFWDGEQMTYGDGSGSNPLVALDVAAHEMTHGITENTANLVYQGDPGGLNEATSDIFGAAVEFHVENGEDAGDYLIGEKIDIRGDGKPLRYMDKPSRDGKSVDCWSTDVNGMDPHYSSGPLNHWFYLASEGSGAKEINGVAYDSPTCDGSTVTGSSREAMEKVWYRTLSTKLTSTSDYPAAREGAIESAIELFGADSAECKATEDAFNAIAVPAGAAACAAGSTPASKGAVSTR
ncbi:M4 family metallopeptidase [Kytococcus sedentarius]|uniref:M4 family metallopeptidase n=1 Tax=Kytococcus sedentarius TaxID=1276 RepID=UPI0035BBB406